jgi:RNA polymerase sigma factor (sigma-70 family)
VKHALSSIAGSLPAPKEKQPASTQGERDHAWYEGLTQDQYHRHYEAVWKRAYLIVGDPHEADLVANKVMDEIWQRESPPSQADIEAHLRTLATSRSIDRNRTPAHRLRMKCHSIIQKNDEGEEYEALPETRSYPGAEEELLYEYDRERFAQQLAQAIIRLSDVQRSCFVLRFLDLMKPEEIAQRLRIPVDTVYTESYRARNRIAKFLNKQEEQPWKT